MWGKIITEATFESNFNTQFPNTKADVLIHLAQWQYWWWFWFSFLWVLYYLFLAKTLRFRTLKFRPKIVSSFRPHGKWGDLIICLLPISWCANILINSNFLLKLLEWQAESSLFTIRIRGKQWYWVYKFDFKNFTDIISTPKNIGNNKWIFSFSGELKASDNYLHIIQLRAQNKSIKTYWTKNLSRFESGEERSNINFINDSFLIDYHKNESLTTNFLTNNIFQFSDSFFLKKFKKVGGNNRIPYDDTYDIYRYKHNSLISNQLKAWIVLEDFSSTIPNFRFMKYFIEESKERNIADCIGLSKYRQHFFIDNSKNLYLKYLKNLAVKNINDNNFDRTKTRLRLHFYKNRLSKRYITAAVAEEFIQLSKAGLFLKNNVKNTPKVYLNNENSWFESIVLNKTFLNSYFYKKYCKKYKYLSATRIADCTGLSKYKHFFKNNGKTLNKGLFDNKNLCSKNTILIKSSFLNTNFYKHLSATPKNASYIINVCLDTVHTPFKKNNSTKRSLVELNESKDLNKSLTAGYYNSTPVDEEKRLYQKYNTTLFPINEDSDRILKQNFGKQSALAFLKLPINNIDFSAKKGFLFKLRNGVVSDITERNVIKVPYFVFKQVRYKRKRWFFSSTHKIDTDYQQVIKKDFSLKNQYSIEDNDVKNPIRQMRMFKKNRTRGENVPVIIAKRLLRVKKTLVIPTHMNITAITNSYDVVHSWFIPGLGLKMDCVPGRSTHHTFYVDNAGFYYGQCAEICGRYHHHMPIRVCALPFEHFLLWWHSFGLPKLMFPSKKYKMLHNHTIRKYVW